MSLAGKSKERLEQLTTQLLWRLQQSSPYHGSSACTDVASPEAIAAMLQDSQGALYEIGIADDGTFVGLDEQELKESLECLQEMASRLGCGVEVLRKVEARRENDDQAYWVAEAFVKPQLAGKERNHGLQNTVGGAPDVPSLELLRVSLIGATGSGKSTLLGSLVTGSLDNGRGKSRLSLFRHRHELVSGVTSSLSHEIIGYRSNKLAMAQAKPQVVHDNSSDHSSWGDICATASASRGRVVIGSDSAGVPRYRRTVLRSLIGWAPHYAIFFVSAEAGDQAGSSSADLNLAYLRLLLKLEIPFLVLVTKLDIATKQSLRVALGRVLSLLKENGRRPVLFPSSQPSHADDIDGWSQLEQTKAEEVSGQLQDHLVAPILFTSSVRGDGIGYLHALLANIPIPSPVIQRQMILFQIDEVFEFNGAASAGAVSAQTVVVSGYMRYGRVSVGGEVLVGPFDGDSGKREWLRFKLTSARRLRSPVHSLFEADVGSLGLVCIGDAEPKLRKGMILTGCDIEPPKAVEVFSARLAVDLAVYPLAPGAHVMVYNASIRAPAEVLAVTEQEKGFFSATFRLTVRKEWMEDGSKVLIVPGGGKTHSLTGLEGFAGVIS